MDGPTPDPARLMAARQVARGYLERKKMWTKVLFVVASLAEAGFFLTMFLFFDFADRFYWFIFFGLSFVYSPLIAFIFRNSVMIDRLYYRLVLELKYGEPRSSSAPGEAATDARRDEARSFLVKKQRWATFLFVISGIFEAAFFFAMLWFMDFSDQLSWFLFFGFMGVYSPLIISAWRNTFAIDRIYYGLINELKYGSD